MNEIDVMLVMDQMVQMFETLVKRIETTEKMIDEMRKCREFSSEKKDNDK